MFIRVFRDGFSGREVIQGMEFIRVSQKFPQISNDPRFVSGLLHHRFLYRQINIAPLSGPGMAFPLARNISHLVNDSKMFIIAVNLMAPYA